MRNAYRTMAERDQTIKDFDEVLFPRTPDQAALLVRGLAAQCPMGWRDHIERIQKEREDKGSIPFDRILFFLTDEGHTPL